MHSQLRICSITPLCAAVGWLLEFLDLRCILLPIPLKANLLKQPTMQASDTQKQQLKGERPSEFY